jgi:hypothetical protein
VYDVPLARAVGMPLTIWSTGMMNFDTPANKNRRASRIGTLFNVLPRELVEPVVNSLGFPSTPIPYAPKWRFTRSVGSSIVSTQSGDWKNKHALSSSRVSHPRFKKG